MEPPAEGHQESPALTEAAAEFLSLIGPEELERCLFTETLEVVAAGVLPRSQWWVTARWAPYEQAGEPMQSCLLVQACGRLDGVPGSSTLKAYVTPQLKTLEQEEQECLELRPHSVERRTHMMNDQHGLTVTKILQEGEAGPHCQTFSYSRAELQGLLLEGASLLLLRVLALRRAVPPGLVFPAIDTEGYLCTISYRPLGTQQQAVGSTEAELFMIERAVHASAGTSTVWHGSFLPSGRLARLVQVGSPMLALLQDESVLDETGGVKPQPLFPKQPLNWEEDIQLWSWFLDRKEELQASHTIYLRQHPELWELLADFLQALLLRQPHDPVSFAAQFFAPREPPGTSFASAGSASPLPSPPPYHPPANGE